MCASRITQEICKGACKFHMSTQSKALPVLKFTPVDEWYIHFVYSCEISLLVSYVLCLDLNLLCSKTCLLHFWHFPNFLPISYACFYAFWVCIILTMCICNCPSLYKNDHHRNKYNVQEKLQYKSFLNCQNLCQCSKFNS